jgi:hypothetical protein
VSTVKAVTDAIERIRIALVAAGQDVHHSVVAAPVPPAAVVGAPSLFWEGYVLTPTRAQFPVYLVEYKDDDTLDRLLDRVPVVAGALDEEPDMIVIGATPTTYAAGSDEFPAYNVTVEVSLQ